MLSKITVVLSSLAVLAAALPYGGDVASQCNGGNLQCCNTVGNSSDKGIQSLLAPLLGAAVAPINVVVGLDCDPITVIGLLASGGKCTQQAVCCQGNNQNGLVNIGCTPISIPV